MTGLENSSSSGPSDELNANNSFEQDVQRPCNDSTTTFMSSLSMLTRRVDSLETRLPKLEGITRILLQHMSPPLAHSYQLHGDHPGSKQASNGPQIFDTYAEENILRMNWNARESESAVNEFGRPWMPDDPSHSSGSGLPSLDPLCSTINFDVDWSMSDGYPLS
jgi:hypothetical protein